ncbi:hypothetical protein [Pelistega europaea]|uniref:HEAT repeat domain-containing protein n=1 Tax=Pelistega europaea TaxID=106147 RepID=A0A7Y4P4V4_9BURK|nr:hypothetical protein [Pelistega europaea]NOL49891.1 hypothetical protein [Pelistega europaea]
MATLILLGKDFSQQQYNFSNKRDIFTFSIQALAKEQSETFLDHHLSLQNKITYAGELFTILLLSNSEGVSNKESVSNAHYPCLKDLLPYEHIQDILNTKLFKIADTENQYVAIHKIIAEFCAAEYLSERLIFLENPLSLKQLLAILAPNNIIRDDLRGVCAWTACLSRSENTQETFIHLDPYGVLTYGDPDILLPTSKKILIEQLIQFADKNPDFIDYQYWNEVHAHNLISKDMENTVNDLLIQSTSFQIRFLVLQLLAKTHEIFLPYVTFENLTLCQDEVIALRRQAALCLVNYHNTTILASTIDKLFNENSTNSLNIISTLIENTPHTKQILVF